jgi:hemerythrin superfamily protein
MNKWEEKFHKLKTDVEHHAKEEENNLFTKVKDILTEEELENIDKEMHRFKYEYAFLI